MQQKVTFILGSFFPLSFSGCVPNEPLNGLDQKKNRVAGMRLGWIARAWVEKEARKVNHHWNIGILA